MAGKTFPASPAQAQPAIFRIWYKAQGMQFLLKVMTPNNSTVRSHEPGSQAFCCQSRFQLPPYDVIQNGGPTWSVKAGSTIGVKEAMVTTYCCRLIVNEIVIFCVLVKSILSYYRIRIVNEVYYLFTFRYDIFLSASIEANNKIWINLYHFFKPVAFILYNKQRAIGIWLVVHLSD